MSAKFHQINDLDALVSRAEGMSAAFPAKLVDEVLREDPEMKTAFPAKFSDNRRMVVESHDNHKIKSTYADLIQPEYPVYRCVFDEDTLQIDTVDVCPSTCNRMEREEFPIMYIGDFANPDTGKFESYIDGLSGAYLVIGNINSKIRANRESLIRLSSWTLEVALCDLLSSSGLWSARIHPLEALSPIQRAKIGSNTRRSRKSHKRSSSVERRVQRRETRALQGDTRRDPDTEMQKKTRCKQAVNPPPLQKFLETGYPSDPDSTAVMHGLECHDNRQRDIVTAAEVLANWANGKIAEKKPEVQHIPDTEVKTVIIGSLSANLGKIFCNWAYSKHSVKCLQLLSSDPTAKHHVFMPETCTGKIRKSIRAKIRRVEKTGRCKI